MDKTNILGCFLKIGFDPNLREQDFADLDNQFSPYIWGERGISDKLKTFSIKRKKKGINF